MNNASANTSGLVPLVRPTVSRVANLPFIITASPIDISGLRMAERYVICHITKDIAPFTVYKEFLKWNTSIWIWEHATFAEPAHRSTYKLAFHNLEFRFRGFNNER